MPASNSAIVLENVTKSYGDIQALTGVSLNAQRGKVLGLLGPNGAGKTTIVRILTTLLKPDSGSAFVSGLDVVENPYAVRRIIGLAGQYPAVDEQLTGRENLEMVGQLYHFGWRESRRRAQELLEQFTLTDAADRPIKTYSGGMRRRLDLAASIVARPEILFLDEPTTGLDPRTRLDLWETIRSLVHGGTTLLLTTQYLEEADQLADRIAVMDHGQIIARGTSNELKAQIAGDFIDLTIENRDQLPRTIELLQPISRDDMHIDKEQGHVSVPVDNGTRSIAEIVRVLDGEQIAIADLSMRRPSLDDVFLAITGKDTESDNSTQHKTASVRSA